MRKSNSLLQRIKRVVLVAGAIGMLGVVLTGCLDSVEKAPGKAIYRINENMCTRCEVCIPECPVNIITRHYMAENQPPVIIIDTDKCIGCGNCAQACTLSAIVKEYE